MKSHVAIAFAASFLLPVTAFAQGTIGGADQGAREGDRAAGPVGAVVGGAVGAATGTVNGVLGLPGRQGCSSETVRKENSAGETETVKRTDCP